MIVIKVELWPYGDKDKAIEIGRCNIYNTGGHPDPHHYGNYGVIIAKPHYFDIARERFGSKYHAHRGYVANFPRGHKNLWPLILAALKSCKLRRTKAEPISHGVLPPKEEVT